jgi:hypothetical protein
VKDRLMVMNFSVKILRYLLLSVKTEEKVVRQRPGVQLRPHPRSSSVSSRPHVTITIIKRKADKGKRLYMY